MPIMSMNKDKMVWFCACGATNTYDFNYGGINTKLEPFQLNADDTLSIRFDNTGGQDGTIENITFASSDFPNLNAITADQLVQKLNSVLQSGIAINDYGTVLIRSNTAGPTSCVEVIDGTSRTAFGFDTRGGDPEMVHHCCERLCLGYRPIAEKMHTEVIILRRCSNCTGQSSLFVNRVDYSASSGSPGNAVHRKAVNSLAKYLQYQGWVDIDLVDYYAQNPYSPTEFFSEYPAQEIDIKTLMPAKFFTNK